MPIGRSKKTKEPSEENKPVTIEKTNAKEIMSITPKSYPGSLFDELVINPEQWDEVKSVAGNAKSESKIA